MNKFQLRETYIRLSKLESIQDCLELLDIFLEHLWNVIEHHHEDEVNSQSDSDAKTLNHMMFTKLTHMRNIIEGVGYTSHNGNFLNKIIDPTIIASMTRNVYETVAVFNLIYRSAKNEDEKDLLYGLWESAGLKFRQRFDFETLSNENKRKIQDEKKQIEEIEREIKNNLLYLSLDDANQAKVDKKLKDKDFKIRFDGDNVIYLNWRDMYKVMELNKDLFEEIYSYFSLYAHPSQVSVFQFRDMFGKDEDFRQLTLLNLKYFFSFISVFVADYINLFPQVKQTFEQLDSYKQNAINAYNKMLRGDDYSINDTWRALE
ncbi:MAG: hypothetical protein GX941_03220 [Candidatus Methanofastidiosa archaeon]|nr:hypothetical protein [Candidatus Methanofastidiosa archaeon]